MSLSAGGVVPDPGGFSLGLGDDDFALVEVPDSGTFAGFPFLGTTYGTDAIFVGSDGHITFGAPDGSSSARDAARHVGGPPRVSALLLDLDPSSDGDVRAEVNAGSVVVTWDSVPQFGVPDSNTVQAVLYADGSLDLNFGGVGKVRTEECARRGSSGQDNREERRELRQQYRRHSGQGNFFGRNIPPRRAVGHKRARRIDLFNRRFAD